MKLELLNFVENIIFSKDQTQVLYKAIHRDKDLEIFLRISITASEQQPIYRVSELAYRYKHSPCVCVCLCVCVFVCVYVCLFLWLGFCQHCN